MPDDTDNTNDFTVDDARAIIGDIKTEANHGANSGDARLAMSARQTLGMALVVEMLLENKDGDAVLKRVDAIEEGMSTSTLGQRVEALENRVADIPDIGDLPARVSALETDKLGERVTALEQNRATVEAPIDSEVTAADADLSNHERKDNGVTTQGTDNTLHPENADEQNN